MGDAVVKEISVIIPTRNRAPILEGVLRSIERQTLEVARFEVIVVDNGSSDRTRDVVTTFGSRIKGLRYIYVQEPGLHRARHRGASEAEAELLTFADDDIEAFPGWLRAIRDSFNEPGVALVGGRILPRFEAPPPAWLQNLWDGMPRNRRWLPYLSILDFGEGCRTMSPYYVWGCNFSIRRDVLVQSGGFHPDAVPKEQRFYRGDGETWVGEHVRSRRLRALYCGSACVHHCIPASRMSVSYFSERAFDQGISDSYTVLRNRLRRGGCGPHGRWASLAHVCRIGGILAGIWVKRLLTRVEGERSSESLRARLFRASVQGFDAHRRKVREDPALRAWVARDDYWDK